MNKEEIYRLRKSLKYSRREFGLLIGKMLGVNRGVAIHTIYRWETGKAKPHAVFEKVLLEIKRLNEIKGVM